MNKLKKYEIVLEKQHICSENCATILLTEKDSDEESIDLSFKPMCFKPGPNPNYIDGKCELFNQTEKSYVHIADYNENESAILHLDEIVIEADDNIDICFDYPLKKDFYFNFRSTGGFSRRHIINLIVETYKKIYRDEEDTTTERKLTFTKKCTACKKEIIAIPEFSFDDDLNDDVCIICLEKYIKQDILCKLPCGHSFHKDCIYKWFDQQKNCPLCIKSMERIEKCFECNDGIVNIEYVGKIIPLEIRKKNGWIVESPSNEWYIWDMGT